MKTPAGEQGDLDVDAGIGECRHQGVQASQHRGIRIDHPFSACPGEKVARHPRSIQRVEADEVDAELRHPPCDCAGVFRRRQRREVDTKEADPFSARGIVPVRADGNAAGLIGRADRTAIPRAEIERTRR